MASADNGWVIDQLVEALRIKTRQGVVPHCNEDWLIDAGTLGITDEITLRGLSIVDASSGKCLAIAIYPVVNLPLFQSLVFKLIRERGYPASVRVSLAVYPIVSERIQSIAAQRGINVVLEPTLDFRTLFDRLAAHLAKKSNSLPRHAAGRSLRRAAEKWRRGYQHGWSAPMMHVTHG
jgi:hypothetical protein